MDILPLKSPAGTLPLEKKMVFNQNPLLNTVNILRILTETLDDLQRATDVPRNITKIQLCLEVDTSKISYNSTFKQNSLYMSLDKLGDLLVNAKAKDTIYYTTEENTALITLPAMPIASLQEAIYTTASNLKKDFISYLRNIYSAGAGADVVFTVQRDSYIDALRQVNKLIKSIEDQKAAEAARAEETRLQQQRMQEAKAKAAEDRARKQKVESTRKEEAKKRQSPLDDRTESIVRILEEQSGNLPRNNDLPAKAKILAAGIRDLAADLDVRSEETLALAEASEEEKAKAKFSRELAKLLLSEENITRAAINIGVPAKKIKGEEDAAKHANRVPKDSKKIKKRTEKLLKQDEQDEREKAEREALKAEMKEYLTSKITSGEMPFLPILMRASLQTEINADSPEEAKEKVQARETAYFSVLNGIKSLDVGELKTEIESYRELMPELMPKADDFVTAEKISGYVDNVFDGKSKGTQTGNAR